MKLSDTSVVNEPDSGQAREAPTGGESDGGGAAWAFGIPRGENGGGGGGGDGVAVRDEYERERERMLMDTEDGGEAWSSVVCGTSSVGIEWLDDVPDKSVSAADVRRRRGAAPGRAGGFSFSVRRRNERRRLTACDDILDSDSDSRVLGFLQYDRWRLAVGGWRVFLEFFAGRGV